ncbi:hypothetical protein F2P56_034182 [Juglans regia]|uniref:Disease resistance protein At4g27220 n=2 Tax=Juglans regia TaxID=51240 RepID=A0A833WU04_JUGRE|nr:probable disease resistance protein At4g27220 [Juglans regia]XP_035541759.1 probable disease resistance protein At4g27220 [Juglans regia]XP_035541760.1 probable disease resistance protein At4g27220 [Juglans regia]KAF5445104.1 hypothetical protein F2P56_034182 [Juglans regia]
MEIIFLIVGKIGEYSVGPIGEQFRYIISYKNNISTLEEKILKLLEKEEAVQQSVDGAQWNQQVVASEVKTWQANVGKRIEEAQKFLEEDVKANRKCLNGWCPDLKLRYSLGKKAQKNTQAIIQLLEEGGKYDRVYNTLPPLVVRSSPTGWFKDFESRKSTIQNVLDALKNDKIDMVALCGMGGIGKTEMAKEIERRVKSDNLFRKVVSAVVSQKPSLTKIQGELAEMLGPKLEAESLHVRANELYSRLTKNKNVLVILDDVWEHLDLGHIGVIDAVKQKSCKILLTSRNEEACNAMRIEKIFPVGLLSKEEAWNLFVEIAGDCINTSDLISIIAKQVAEECARLPLAIAIVGGALRNKRDKKEWKAALQQLKMSNPDNIYGLHPKVYSSIEFSYNYLQSGEAKSCFLLCCLYPEDYDVPIEDLVRYGVTKRFLKGLGTVEQTRELVHTIVKNLIRSNLLLDSNWKERVKMHDVVRDVSISIASRDENGFMVVLDPGLEEWPQKDRYDSYTTISLLLGEMKGHPTELKYPKLELLQLSCLNHSETFSSNLFNGMKELKMLYLQKGCFSLTMSPPSIQILQNLQMLNLENCRLGDVSAIGTLRNLEILNFCDSEIMELPSEIGNLSRLKLLDMKRCRPLKRIAAGVLSGLCRLEELYAGDFKNWGCTTMMEGNGAVTNNNASLAELIPYSSQLVVLEISTPSILCLPKELDFSNSNFRFMINIGRDYRAGERYLFENTLKLEVEDASDLGEHRTIRSMLKKAIVLSLDIGKNSKHIWFEKEEKGILPCSLKGLTINRCEDLEYLLEATSDSTPPNTFYLLESLSLNYLPWLIGICKFKDSVEVEREGSTASTPVAHKLFSSNSILWVPNLKLLDVEGCGSLEVIFDLEGLKVKENRKPILAVLFDLRLWNLSGMSHVWKNIPPGFQGFQNLTLINIKNCHSLRNLLPGSIAKLLVQLQVVTISKCNLMENIIQREYEAGEERRADILSSETHSLEWPSIKSIKLLICPKLKTFGLEVQSGRKQRKMDAELDPRAQEPSAASSSTRQSSGLFNRCLESCVPRPRNYSPALHAQGKSSSSLGENKHDLIKKEITLTKQEEQNVSKTENQAKMLSLFPYNLIESLKNLQKLSANQCDSLEVIFELEGLNAEESNIFNNLRVLSLHFLPKLLHIWKKGPRDIKGFNYLRLLQVWKCGSLKCLFTPSIAKLLVKVEEIDVYGCNEMEEILAKELGDEENRDVIAFSLVNTLKLGNLPKLECFYTEDNHAFEWPSLNKMQIYGCPKLKMFVSTSTKTPKLKGVHMRIEATFQPMVEGDLNTTIQHIIKRKGLNHFYPPPKFSQLRSRLQEDIFGF